MATGRVIFKIGIGALLAMSMACATTGPAPVGVLDPVQEIGFASPLAGPGGSQLSRRDEKHLAEGWRALKFGNFPKAEEKAAMTAGLPESTLLALQVRLLTDDGDPEILSSLEAMTRDLPLYASAWGTLAEAARRQDREKVALNAARTVSDLWPKGPFGDRAGEFEAQWIDGRIEDASTKLEAESWTEAIDLTATALELDPGNQAAMLIGAEARIGQGRLTEAEEALAALGDLPEALLLRASIAQREQQWHQAMDLLTRLPDDNPHKKKSLRRARLRWRLSILPVHVREAAAAEEITREQLAVLLVALSPELETIEGGRTPLMPDILSRESQRAILTVTRLEIMRPMGVENQFLPLDPADIETVRSSIEAVSHLVGYGVPLWCEGSEMVQSGCTAVSEPISGGWVTEALLALEMEDEGE